MRYKRNIKIIPTNWAYKARRCKAMLRNSVWSKGHWYANILQCWKFQAKVWIILRLSLDHQSKDVSFTYTIESSRFRSEFWRRAFDTLYLIKLWKLKDVWNKVSMQVRSFRDLLLLRFLILNVLSELWLIAYIFWVVFRKAEKYMIGDCLVVSLNGSSN